jgi:hypothetical protein
MPFTNASIIGSDITAVAACTTHVNRLIITQVPTASAGLPTGAIWSNSGVLYIVG